MLDGQSKDRQIIMETKERRTNKIRSNRGEGEVRQRE